MVAPAHMEPLLDHLKNGVYYEVLQWKAVRDHEDAVRQLIAGDNFDAAFVLGQTDLALLEAIHASTQIRRPTSNKSCWELLQPHLPKLKGGRWSEEDLICFYNFDQTVSDAQIQFLIMFAPFVEWDEVRLQPMDFELTSKIRANVLWVKTCCIVAQYTSSLGLAV